MTYRVPQIWRSITVAGLLFAGISLAVGTGRERSPALANTETEWRQLMQSKRTDFVRNASDWNGFVAQAKTKSGHPLAGVDSRTVKAFTDKLVFRNGGLAGASYAMLKGKLTEAQFEALWATFGMSKRYLQDHDNKECSSRATCSTAYACICTSNCFQSRPPVLRQ